MFGSTRLSVRAVATSPHRPIVSTVSGQFLPLPITQLKRLATVVSSQGGERYWSEIPQWKHVTEDEFKSYRWQIKSTVGNKHRLANFLQEAVPELLEPSSDVRLHHIRTRDDFIKDALAGLELAPMAIRLTPHTLSRIDWPRALDDPIRRQFIPLKSCFVQDHEKLSLDSLHEESDSPVPGLVHRYPDKALFLATSLCPTYCRFCTRSYAVGDNTDTVEKKTQKASRRRWELVFQHIEKTKQLTDIVVSGGDVYQLAPEHIREIADRLLSIDHIRRIRFASKGLAVLPSRTLDPSDTWTQTFIDVSAKARDLGKHLCLHTHFDHPNEITWITRAAAQHLYRNNVIVRNQSVLLKGVNDNPETMGRLIRELADINITPYYVYQCDMVRGIEDLRTPLSVILDMEERLRGTIAGYYLPQFVVDLPGGGGKRLAATYTSYSQETGISTFRAPGLLGEKGQKVYEYYDPKPLECGVRTDTPQVVEPQHKYYDEHEADIGQSVMAGNA